MDGDAERALKLVVTGGCGFIGSALVRHVIEHTPHAVINVDSLTYAGDPSTVASVATSDRYHFQRDDVTDRARMRKILTDLQPDAILHLAAESNVDRSIDGPAVFVDTNVVGTATLLDESLRYWESLSPERAARFRFLYVSTDEVYGSLPPNAFSTEKSLIRPNSPYAASKASGDLFVRAYHETWGLPVLVTHASNNYGPFQFPEKLVPTVVLAALEAAPIPLYGKGDNVRDWIFVEDHVAALLAILERGIPGSTYDVGARSARRNLEVVHTLCALLDRLVPAGKPHASRIAFVADRPGHDRRYAIDPTRLETELGFRTETPFEVGMEATVRWYLEHRDWWERIRREIYDGRRLGVPRARPKGSTP